MRLSSSIQRVVGTDEDVSPSSPRGSTSSHDSRVPEAASLGPTAKAQRARILQAMVEVVAERGFQATSVRLVSQRAGVSNRTFYELFGQLESCFMEVLDEGAERAKELMCQAFASAHFWIDGVRSSLAALLILLESEPRRARVWQLEALAAGAWALERRMQHMEMLRLIAIRHWTSSREWQDLELASEGAMAAVGGVLHSRLLLDSSAPLLEMLGPLMGLVVAPFVDTGTRVREIQRGHELAHAILEGRSSSALYTAAMQIRNPRPLPDTNSRVLLPGVLGSRSARRGRECLLAIATQPGASNSEVAKRIGVSHESQISRLLATLAKEKLVVKRSLGRGQRNEWRLTPQGEQVAQKLQV